MPDHPSLTSPLVAIPALKPVEKMEPYKPCWCESGAKFKFCHYRRHEHQQINVYEIETRIVAANQAGACSHPDPVTYPCRGKVIKAHTIQRSGGLSAIAEAGHVLTVKPIMKGLLQDEGESWPRQIGIGKASVFPGFCEKHDTSLFKKVEGDVLPLDGDHAFLLAYRAIAYELFSKEGQRRGAEVQRDMDRGFAFWKQAVTQRILHGTLFGIQMGLADIRRMKGGFDRRLLTMDLSGFHHLAVRFDSVLPIVACTAFHPEWDLSGKRLQRLGHGDALFELITLTVTAFQGQTVAVLGWIGDADGPAGKLAKSFADIADDRKADALLRLLFVQTDNLFLRPSWWEGLERDDQERLVRQVMTGTHMKVRAAGDLEEDGRRLLNSDVIETHAG